MKIGKEAYFAPGVVIDFLFPSLIEIGDGCFLGEGCKIWAHDITPDKIHLGRVRIGAGAVIGGNAMVHCGVGVGEYATVGPCSLVTKDVPDGATVLGIPARQFPIRAYVPEDGDADGGARVGQGDAEKGSARCS